MHPMRQHTTDLARMRHLEKAGGWTRRERLRCLWYRLRLTVQEMNYATRRIAELQAPWTSDSQWWTRPGPEFPAERQL